MAEQLEESNNRFLQTSTELQSVREQLEDLSRIPSATCEKCAEAPATSCDKCAQKTAAPTKIETKPEDLGSRIKRAALEKKNAQLTARVSELEAEIEAKPEDLGARIKRMALEKKEFQLTA